MGGSCTRAVGIVHIVNFLPRQTFTKASHDRSPRERKAGQTKLLSARILAWSAVGTLQIEHVRDLVSSQRRCVCQLPAEIIGSLHPQCSNTDAGAAGCRSDSIGKRGDLACLGESKRELKRERRGSIARCQHRHCDLERRAWRSCHDHGDAIRSG